jgi:nanoRNase/pAp phosphatase (c-di-AMP/oligoRNAs hydrolase)
VKVITSHMGNDFDSIASMVAASKLYPDAVLSLSGSTSRTVRDFLRKFPQRWPIVTPRKVRKDEVTQLIIVDTRSRSRIGPYVTLLGRKDVSVHVYDHHPPSFDDIDGELMVIDPVGATTTLLVEILLERQIPITPHEATKQCNIGTNPGSRPSIDDNQLSNFILTHFARSHNWPALRKFPQEIPHRPARGTRQGKDSVGV